MPWQTPSVRTDETISKDSRLGNIHKKHPDNPLQTTVSGWADYTLGSIYPMVNPDNTDEVLLFADGKDTLGGPNTEWDTGLFRTTDGLNFTEASGNPVLSNSNGFGDVTVRVESGTWKCWGWSTDGSGNFVVRYYTGSGPTDWSEDPNSPVLTDADFSEVASEHDFALTKTGGTYYLFSWSGGNSNPRYESSDGVSWTTRKNTNLYDFRCRKVRVDSTGRWWMYGSAFGNTHDQKLQVWTSRDGLNWTLYRDSVTRRAVSGGKGDDPWDSYAVSELAPVLDWNGRDWWYYVGHATNFDGGSAVGLIESPNLVTPQERVQHSITAYNSSDTTFTGGSHTKIPIDTVNGTDTGAMFDSADNGIVIPRNAEYKLSGLAHGKGFASGEYIQFGIYVDSVDAFGLVVRVGFKEHTDGDQYRVIPQFKYPLDEGQVVYIGAYHNAGGSTSRTVQDGLQNNYLTVEEC